MQVIFKLILCLCLLWNLAFKLRLLFLCDLEPLLVLEALVLGLDILTYLIRHGLSAFFCVELILIEFPKGHLLLLLVALDTSFVEDGILIGGLEGPLGDVLHHCLGVRLVDQKFGEVLIGVCLTLKLLSIHFVKHMLDYVDVEVLMWVKLNKLLFLFVKNQHENVQAAHLGQLNGFLDEASLSLWRSDLSLGSVMNESRK